MASIVSRNGNLYVTFTDATRKPTQRRLSLKTRSRRTAERIVPKLEEGYATGAFDPWTQTPDEFLNPERPAEPKKLGEAVAEFIAARRRELKPSTISVYTRRLGYVVTALGADTYLQRITPADVRKGVEHAAPYTYKCRLIAAQSFFTWAAEREFIAENPARKVTAPPPPERLPKAVTDEEFDLVLSHVSEGRAWMIPAFRFAALTGLRVSELCRLEWDHVDFDNRLVKIEVQKNGLAQTQPIPRAAVAVIERLPRFSPYVFGSRREIAAVRKVDAWTEQLSEAFREARREAGIERKITPHGLRHRYCTKLAEAGASAFVIQRAARHADVNVSQRYVHIANGELRDELDAVFG